MRPRTSVFIATSLDGFIARINGNLDWLIGEDGDAKQNGPDNEDYGYNAFFDTVDGLVMGRYSFEKVLSFKEWPYSDKPVFVLSTRPVEVPSILSRTVSVLSLSPAELCERLSGQGFRHLYVDGGITIQRFLAAGLIDTLTITRIPVLLGEGRPLFGPLARDVHLTHITTRAFPNGYVQSTYRVISQ